AELCAMSAEDHEALMDSVNDMAAQGLRVLGVARGVSKQAALPATPRAITFEFLGLAGLADPLRSGVTEAVRECQAAGIRVIMITGDYPATAIAIARQAGLADGAAVAGRELDKMDDDALAAAVMNTSVFARVTPDQKLRLVQALKAGGEIVGMTGDGVND